MFSVKACFKIHSGRVLPVFKTATTTFYLEMYGKFHDGPSYRFSTTSAGIYVETPALELCSISSAARKSVVTDEEVVCVQGRQE